MILLHIGLILSTGVFWVEAQGAAFTTEVCTNFPCTKDSFEMAFRLSGTPPATAAQTVGFYRNGEGGSRPCGVLRSSPCNASASCGCTETGSDRIYHYRISIASSADHDGNWTAILPASTASDTVRSSVCRVKVNDSCPFLVQDVCAKNITTGETLNISFTQTRQFPSTAGASLNFILNRTTTTVEGTVKWNECPQNTFPAGCFEREGKMVYYISITALPRYTGGWTAVVDAIPSSGTVKSDVCNVTVPEPESPPVSIALVCVLALISTAYMVTLILLQCVCSGDGKVNVIVAFAGAVIVLIFVIAVGSYSLGTFVVVTRAYRDLYGASIAFVVIGCIAVVIGIVLGIKTLIQSSSDGNKKKTNPK